MTRKTLAVFYHIWTSPDVLVSRFLVDEQIKRLVRSGLSHRADIFCIITGENSEFLAQFLSAYSCVTILDANSPADLFELGTLRHLYRHCIQHPETEAVLYMHTKGLAYYTDPVSSPDSPSACAVNSWRHLMEWALIDRWENALQSLKGYDMTGCSPVEGPSLHYPGNFWWARPGYIATLEDPESLIQRMTSGPMVSLRMQAEKWPGSGTVLSRIAMAGAFAFPEGTDPSRKSPYFTDMAAEWLKSDGQPS